MALHRFMGELDWQRTKPLVTCMPVNIRQPGASLDQNMFHTALVKLGEADAEPLERLQQVRAPSVGVKSEIERMG